MSRSEEFSDWTLRAIRPECSRRLAVPQCVAVLFSSQAAVGQDICCRLFAESRGHLFPLADVAIVKPALTRPLFLPNRIVDF